MGATIIVPEEGGGSAPISPEDLKKIANYTTVTTVPTITGDINNWNPTGLATSNLLRVDVNANNHEISGIVRPAPIGEKQIIAISNLNQNWSLKFLHNDALSTPANRFLLRDGADKSIKPNETAIFHYDNVLGRWMPFNRVG